MVDHLIHTEQCAARYGDSWWNHAYTCEEATYIRTIYMYVRVHTHVHVRTLVQLRIAIRASNVLHQNNFSRTSPNFRNFHIYIKPGSSNFIRCWHHQHWQLKQAEVDKDRSLFSTCKSNIRDYPLSACVIVWCTLYTTIILADVPNLLLWFIPYFHTNNGNPYHICDVWRHCAIYPGYCAQSID